MSAIYLDDIEQGSEQWYACRIGIPTASRFDSIITPTKGELSKQSGGYLRELLAEWLSGTPAESYSSGWMQRGTEMEAEARAYYAFSRDVDVRQVGFVYADGSRNYGCSPDGLIDEDGLLEMKCPKPGTHVGYLMDNRLPRDYLPQVQGSLLVTGRQWADFMSYCPGLPPFLICVERDEEYIGKMREALSKFVADLHAGRQQLIERGFAPMELAA